MTDLFGGAAPYQVQGPFSVGEAVDISAADHVFTNTTRGIYVGTAGNLQVIMQQGVTLTFNTLPVGFHPIRAKRVIKAGTTAAAMVGLW
jgi:hypothetical protein